MFESSLSLSLTPWSQAACGVLDADYHKCWKGIPINFTGSRGKDSGKEGRRED